MTVEEYYGNDLMAIDVIKNKYLHEDETTLEQMWHRIAKAIASIDTNKDEWEEKFYSLLEDFQFIPGGRIMHAAGFEKKGMRLPSLSNCYFIPIEEDSIEGIKGWEFKASQVYRSGGGVGTELGVLRPKGAPVNASINVAPGSVSFMNSMSETTETISQSGRRGALMITLRVDHPDIEDFIKIKSDTNTVKHANISVKLTDEFLNAVTNNSDFELRWNNKVFRTIKAKELWDKIIFQAWKHAEPGLIFWDNMKNDHNLEYEDPLMGTNPCGEIPLPSWDACNLGHFNLSKYVDPSGTFWFDKFIHDVKIAVRFLDNVITYNIDRHAVKEIKETVTKNRRTGLGITGLADAFVKMKIKYDSEKGLKIIDEIMSAMKISAYETSIELAKERGSFPRFDKIKFLKSGFVKRLPKYIKDGIRSYGIRNCTLLTIAPVGTGSIIAQCSSGMEPIFQLWYDRDIKQESSRNETKTYRVYHKLIKDIFGEIQSINELPEFIVTAHSIDPKFRIKMQSVIQDNIDSSISSTINLPRNVKKDVVSQIYLDAWKAGLKGVTVYREGCREGVIRSINTTKNIVKKRAFKLEGDTFKLPIGDKKLYITINSFEDDNSRPFEIFIGTYGDPSRNADLEALAMTLSALYRREPGDLEFLMEKFYRLHDPSINIWWNDPDNKKGTRISSIPKAIAIAHRKFLTNRKKGRKKEIEQVIYNYTLCTNCNEISVIQENGCDRCLNCGTSERCS